MRSISRNYFFVLRQDNFLAHLFVLSCVIPWSHCLFFLTRIDGFQPIKPELFVIVDRNSMRTVLTSIDVFVLRSVFAWVFDSHVCCFLMAAVYRSPIKNGFNFIIKMVMFLCFLS